MNTDLQRFIELYKSFGVECIVNPEADQFAIKLVADQDAYMFRDEGATAHKSFNEGYTGFYTVIKFDSNGKYLSQGFYE